jgi:hypothetical protein
VLELDTRRLAAMPIVAQVLIATAVEVALAWVVIAVAPERLRVWLLPVALICGALAAVLIIYDRGKKRGRILGLEAEDKNALAPRILLECAAKLVSLDGGRERHLSRMGRRRCLRHAFREVEEQWATADVEVATCKPVYQEGAEWKPDVSKVGAGVMLSLHCSNTGLLRGLACRVDDQQSMKHQSPRTGPLAMLQVRFKYPRDFDTAPALPNFGEWLEASWFRPLGESEGIQDVGLGAEIVTCRFRVIQSSPAISSRVQT